MRDFRDAYVAPFLTDRDVADAAEMHDAVDSIEAGKQIPLRMPQHFDGLMESWHEGGMAASSMVLPRADGTPAPSLPAASAALVASAATSAAAPGAAAPAAPPPR